jgi:hypothetical protein
MKHPSYTKGHSSKMPEPEQQRLSNKGDIDEHTKSAQRQNTTSGFFSFIINIITVGIGLLFLLFGIGSLGVGDLPEILYGIFLLAAGTIALAPISSHLRRKIKWLGGRFTPLLISIAIAFLGSVVLPLAVKFEKSTDPKRAAIRAREIAARENARQKEVVERKKQEAIQKKQKDELALRAKKLELEEKSAAMQSKFAQFSREIAAVLGPCDTAQISLAAHLQGGALLSAYEKAEQGRQACFDGYHALDDITPPKDIPESSKEYADAGLEACQNALMHRGSFMSTASKYIDGDRRPSVLASAKQDTQAAEEFSKQCALFITIAATEAGIKINTDK